MPSGEQDRGKNKEKRLGVKNFSLTMKGEKGREETRAQLTSQSNHRTKKTQNDESKILRALGGKRKKGKKLTTNTVQL